MGTNKFRLPGRGIKAVKSIRVLPWNLGELNYFSEPIPKTQTKSARAQIRITYRAEA